MIITTSWDDGHPNDQRLADLLAAYGLKGTFYIPKQSQRVTMSEREVRELASRFEVAAHTMDHLALTTLSLDEARRQIVDSRQWVEQTTDRPCILFCPPLGKFRQSHVQMIEAAGFQGFRTVELGTTVGAIKASRLLWELPTTVQAHPHASSAYLKNAIRRRRLRNGVAAIRNWHRKDWLQRADWFVQQALVSRGVFHLWGHSWEIEENNQWQALEQMMSRLSQLISTGQAISITNGELCKLNAQAP